MKCRACEKTDGLIYTTFPPKVRCFITGNYHFYDDECDVKTECQECKGNKNDCCGCGNIEREIGQYEREMECLTNDVKQRFMKSINEPICCEEYGTLSRKYYTPENPYDTFSVAVIKS